ncbi:MAG: DUF2079 domain-containing protein, partial [Candidatus Bathyarchaeota archaeon]|nr:DUF2079 domain-containing protein [Candidatus Bathyarchaeota archaeon]
FSYNTILKYHSFRTYAWDLGIFSQSLWTTLYEGKLFYNTVELFIFPSGSFFGSHFSPILFLVLPVYALYSTPETLLVFQSFILALGSVPLYLLTRDALKSRVAGVVFVLAYLLYPPLHGVNWFDFHVQAFLPVLFFCTMYFMNKEKWLPYFFFVFLALSVAENVPVVVVFIGIYGLWLFRKQAVKTLRQRTLQDKRILIPLLTIIIAVFWRFFATSIQTTYFPINPDYLRLYKAVDNWSVLGIHDDPLNLPVYVILNPGRAIGALTYDAYLKLLYIILLFGPLLFWSFRSYKTAITLAWFLPVFFSNYTPYYLIGTHFPAYVIAFIFLGTVDALRKKIKNQNFQGIGSYMKNIMLLALLFAGFASPLSPLLTTFRSDLLYFSDYYPPSVTRHEELLQIIVDMVPENASVLTQNNIFPHFSNRINAYVYPISKMKNYARNETQNYIDELFEISEYVVIDVLTDQSVEDFLEETFNGNYGIYALIDGIYLFKRGYVGKPVFND